MAPEDSLKGKSSSTLTVKIEVPKAAVGKTWKQVPTINMIGDFENNTTKNQSKKFVFASINSKTSKKRQEKQRPKHIDTPVTATAHSGQTSPIDLGNQTQHEQFVMKGSFKNYLSTKMQKEYM